MLASSDLAAIQIYRDLDAAKVICLIEGRWDK